MWDLTELPMIRNTRRTRWSQNNCDPFLNVAPEQLPAEVPKEQPQVQGGEAAFKQDDGNIDEPVQQQRKTFYSSINNNSTAFDPAVAIDTLEPVLPKAVFTTLDTTVHSEFNSSSASAIVQLAVGSTSLLTTTAAVGAKYAKSCSSFVAVNAVGMVYVMVAIVVAVGENEKKGEKQQRCSLDMVAAWNTGRCGLTSVAVTESGNIVLGYQSGHVESWTLTVNVNTTQLQKETKLPSNRHDVEPPVAAVRKENVSKQWSAILQWRAAFHNGPQPIITAIAQLRVPQPTEEGNDQSVSESANVISEDALVELDSTNPSTPPPSTTPLAEEDVQSPKPEYLVLTLHRDSSTRPSTASLLEVVDVTSIAKAWNHQFAGFDNAASAAVYLEEHSVVPEAGREVLDLSTFPSVHDNRRVLPSPSYYIPSIGTNCLCSMTSSTAVSVAAGLADGMVTVVSGAISVEEQLAWGVSTLMDQLCLSYPCIGMGCVDLNVGDEVMPCVVCCLRGTATYMIPMVSASSIQSDICGEDEVLMFALSVPHDIDEDSSLRYLQSFAAFNLSTESASADCGIEGQCQIPILVYAWPGGVVDIYSGELLRGDARRRRD